MVDSTIPFSSNPKTLKRQSHNSWTVQNAIGAGRQTTSVDTGKFAMLKRAATYLQSIADSPAKAITGHAFSELVRAKRLTALDRLRLYTGQLGPEIVNKTKTVKSVLK